MVGRPARRAVLIAALGIGCSSPQPPEKSGTAGTLADDEARIIRTATTLLGLPEAPATARKVDEAHLPMIRSALGRGPFWVVTVTHALRVDLSPPVTGFEVYATLAGRPFAVRTTPVTRAWVPASVHEEALRQSSIRFTGLVDGDPVPLVPLLEGEVWRSIARATTPTQQLEAFLVQLAPAEHLRMKDAWVLRLRGSELEICPPPAGDGRSAPCTTHPTAWEVLADARTGELRGRGNSPDGDPARDGRAAE
jgi:hypothetical protein